MIYRLSHYLGDGNLYHQHWIDGQDDHAEEWLETFITDAKRHPNPEYALKVETFGYLSSEYIRPKDTVYL